MNIDDKINLLPYDIRILIYNKFWQLEIDKILNSQESQNLNYKPLYNFFIKNDIINNKMIIDNFREHYEYFDIVYKEHYINNKNVFINFDKLNSLCLLWLMYMYH
jgi:hypothetical protein